MEFPSVVVLSDWKQNGVVMALAMVFGQGYSFFVSFIWAGSGVCNYWIRRLCWAHVLWITEFDPHA